MGRLFLGAALEPFLNNGFNLAILQSVGKCEYFIDKLHICDIGLAKTAAPSFRNFPDKLSIPAALSSLRNFNI